MNTENVFTGCTIDGKMRLLLRVIHYYDIDRFFYDYVDLETKEVFSYLDVWRDSLVSFRETYNSRKHITKRKILKMYRNIDNNPKI